MKVASLCVDILPNFAGVVTVLEKMYWIKGLLDVKSGLGDSHITQEYDNLNNVKSPN